MNSESNNPYRAPTAMCDEPSPAELRKQLRARVTWTVTAIAFLYGVYAGYIGADPMRAQFEAYCASQGMAFPCAESHHFHTFTMRLMPFSLALFGSLAGWLLSWPISLAYFCVTPESNRTS